MSMLTLKTLSGLGFGFLAGEVEDYTACRTKHPASKTPGVLTQSDPCYQELVAYRRSEGRDPLGRDLWGPSGAPKDTYTPSSVQDQRADELGVDPSGLPKPLPGKPAPKPPAPGQPLPLIIPYQGGRKPDDIGWTGALIGVGLIALGAVLYFKLPRR